MTFRFPHLAAAILAAAIVGCSDTADERPASGADTTVAAATPGAAGIAPGQAGADDGVIMDSIPLRTPQGGPARFSKRTGRLVYTYSGSVEGRRISYFTDWGMREWRLDSTEPAAGKPGVPQRGMVISQPDQFIKIDLTMKTGMRMPNTSDEEYLQSDSGKTFSLGEMIFRHSGGRRLPDTTIDGRTVGVLQLDQGFASTRVYVWQGFVLREEFKAQDGTDFTVVLDTMEFDVDVPESLFTVPAGITVTDGPPPGSQQGPPPGAMPPGGMPPGGMPPGGMPPGGMPPGGMPPGGMPPGGAMPRGR